MVHGEMKYGELVRVENILNVPKGPKIVDGVYRNRSNFELDMEFNSPNLIGVVMSNRLRYANDKRCRRPSTESPV
jgi:hypothetical protein